MEEEGRGKTRRMRREEEQGRDQWCRRRWYQRWRRRNKRW
jgi:hypothetical protein